MRKKRTNEKFKVVGVISLILILFAGAFIVAHYGFKDEKTIVNTIEVDDTDNETEEGIDASNSFLYVIEDYLPYDGYSSAYVFAQNFSIDSDKYIFSVDLYLHNRTPPNTEHEFTIQIRNLNESNEYGLYHPLVHNDNFDRLNTEGVIVENYSYKNISQEGWYRIEFTPTLLSAGQYFLYADFRIEYTDESRYWCYVNDATTGDNTTAFYYTIAGSGWTLLDDRDYLMRFNMSEVN